MLRTSWVHDVGVIEELAEWLLRNRNTSNDIWSRWRWLMYNRNEYQGPKQPKITECMDYVLCCCCHDDIDTTHPIDRFPRRDF